MLSLSLSPTHSRSCSSARSCSRPRFVSLAPSLSISLLFSLYYSRAHIHTHASTSHSTSYIYLYMHTRSLVHISNIICKHTISNFNTQNPKLTHNISINSASTSADAHTPSYMYTHTLFLTYIQYHILALNIQN